MKNQIIASTTFAVLLSLTAPAFAGQAPDAASTPDVPISARDRVYAADQTSSTVSVYNPQLNKLLAVRSLIFRVEEELMP